MMKSIQLLIFLQFAVVGEMYSQSSIEISSSVLGTNGFEVGYHFEKKEKRKWDRSIFLQYRHGKRNPVKWGRIFYLFDRRLCEFPKKKGEILFSAGPGYMVYTWDGMKVTSSGPELVMSFSQRFTLGKSRTSLVARLWMYMHYEVTNRDDSAFSGSMESMTIGIKRKF